ncbi:putative membrane-bound dehydrogenase-like protein [Saonia flava]|uniref:Putative membrane-bound dehydrogenase-like protein n=1 Tax=Saonia flava TaxID=523696 RepID=A0A846QTF6_9FLAO|nr:HEAT repeat domain-containing protein [Saonia flava]NJB70507.1 putative membrane-bound dehydrogenase-like protein [Saonia flava]
MKVASLMRYPLSFLVLLSILFSCDNTPKIPTEIPLAKVEDSVNGVLAAKEARANISPFVADGITLSLWASDSLAPDPIAMDIDNEGRVYITRTNRQKNSEFDIRPYQHWMIPSIGFQSIEDRRAFLHETFAPEKSEENSWLKDLNKDSIHDWRDLAVEKEEVWMLEDRNNDGVADISTRILEDFNTEITDPAGALLVRDNDVFVGAAPDMWRLTDTNGDKVLDTKTSLANGFAVHIGFSGHGMSGAIEGPDGKIYWGIGDIGANLTTVDGVNHKYPNQGIIVRCNPDGSDFEIFARGLRNTHEFVFDEYGNIISSDNDGDHRGESERLVYIVEGSDAGWRSNWQYGKYVDPKNNGYKVWMDEKLYTPRWEGQAAYIIPPIKNFHNGPTGMVYNPGTALGKDWLNKFFLVEFVGDPSLSHIWSFDLKPSGAGFELNSDNDMISGILPTGLEFGPDGALYAADWINGWGTNNAGRVWKIDVVEDKNDLEAEREETKRLMTLNYSDQSNDELVALLRYPDMRIRQKAQFQLAKSTFWGYRALKNVLTEETDQLARIHAIWGIGQIAGENASKAEPLVALLQDQDAEIVAQAAKILGDVKYMEAAEPLLPLLQHSNDRVKFFAAQALGRLEHKDGVQGLLDMIVANADKDVYLRHAAVLALSRIGAEEQVAALVDNENRSLRIAAVLVLRRLQSPLVAQFLNDKDEYIVTEAARAINDDWSIEQALPALAAMLNQTQFTSEPLLRRAINAALRVGGEKELNDLIAFAKRTNVPSILRGEALATIGTWASPSTLDRVDGRFRGEITRDANTVKQKIEGDIPAFLADKDQEILIGTSKVLGALQIETYNDQLHKIMTSHSAPQVRGAMLEALGGLNYANMESSMKLGMQDKNWQVRASAVGLISKLDIPKEKLPAIVGPVFRNGSVGEQQRLMSVLGEMPIEKTSDVLSGLITQADKNQLKQGVILDLIEAVEATKSPSLIAQLDKIKKSGQTVDAYKETLEGGQRWPGMQVFNSNPTAQCVRCHAVGGAGGKVGPALDNIGNILSREQLLEALIEPGKRLAPGYGSVTLTLKDGQVVTGVLMEETQDQITLKTSDAEPFVVATSRIEKRTNLPSGMPAMGRLIERRDLRNLIEYLTTLKVENEREAASH